MVLNITEKGEGDVMDGWMDLMEWLWFSSGHSKILVFFRQELLP